MKKILSIAEPDNIYKQIFKNGIDFQFREVNWNSKGKQRALKRLKKEQDASLESAKVDINKLREIQFDI